MSYYSDVAIVCYDSHLREFAFSHVKNDMLNSAMLHQFKNDTVVLNWSGIQWDTTDPDIIELRNWLETVPHRFIRTGETVGDVEDYSHEDDDGVFEGVAEPVTTITIESDAMTAMREFIATRQAAYFNSRSNT